MHSDCEKVQTATKISDRSTAMHAHQSILTKLRHRAFAPIDIASLIFFRVAFGLLMTWEVWRYFHYDWIRIFWIAPRFLFKFYGFGWIQPWAGNGLFIHWAVLGVLALFIAAGFLYRLSAPLFFLGYTYAFLLDETRYLNHAYLICLLSFLLIFLPANRAFSVDAWLFPKSRSDTAPAWTLWLLRVQMGVAYFFSGVAKLSPDWLQGEPMRIRLSHRPDFPILGRFFREEWAVYAMSYGALLFDLLIVPFLLWRRTRLTAFCVAAGFHLMNARLFSIGVFPWLAIAATALFFAPSWPRWVVSIFRGGARSVSTDATKSPPLKKQFVILNLIMIYLAIQILVPLRPFLYFDGTEWTFGEHRFCWRMMLQDQSVRGYFYVTDPNIDKTFQVHPRQFLNAEQMGRIFWHPDMILQFAHYLATVMPRVGPKPLKVQVRMFVSVNGRKPELFVDPIVDLAAEQRSLKRPRWLLPIHEPLPPHEENVAGKGPSF